MCPAFGRGASWPLALMVSASRAPYMPTGSEPMTTGGFARLLLIDRFAITFSVTLASRLSRSAQAARCIVRMPRRAG